jgi:hypothetical protein
MEKNNERIQDLEGEVWKDIQGYEGFYQISNKGRVKRLERLTEFWYRDYKKTKFLPEIIKEQCLNGQGYPIVSLTNGDASKVARVHRLIAIHFIPNLENPENRKQVNHKDKNRQNNSIENLEWVSPLENICHSRKERKKNTSKYIGVHWDKKRQKWRSDIRFLGKYLTIGSYDTEKEAYEARRKFEQDNGIENKYL